jgi:N-acetyl-anhydromuramyl-L-alanine amidase AmpD
VSYPFIQARHYTPTSGRTVDLLVVHTMEAVEKPGTAEEVARWFAGRSAPRASAHFCVDGNSIVACVRDDDIAWHAPGANHNGLGLEHAGYASQRRRDWSDPYSEAMLAVSARLAAEKCRKYGIPPVWLYPADLRAGRRGITSHRNVSVAFHRSDHTDPGSGFPVERYLRLIVRHLGGGLNGRQVKQPPATIRRGDSGWLVKRLQKLLTIHGFSPGPSDGVFGPQTDVAVRAFQRSEDLVADGIAGPMTWRALESEA